ncbi:ABC-type nitrate/sulfonate/bicarbonate transport system, periplasmic component [Puniceibacterium sp. IMCC21224]|nr:ABC-type nitrate/sulfonate/bicarbonate transport system, periplasmic component [Puniceibacterium sp. IMCC21224]
MLTLCKHTNRSMPLGSVASAALLSVTMALPVAAQEIQNVSFILDWIPSGEMAAYYSGVANGFFEEEGINLSISRGYGSSDTVAKIAGGVADFGIADIAAVFTGRAVAQAPVKAISAVYTHSPHSLFVLESSGIDGFDDLEGKSIAVSAGNSHRLYFPAVAERSGIDADKIKWVTADASSMAALLIAKRVDAAPFFSIHEYYQNKAAETQGEKIKVLPFVEAGFAIYSTSVIATEETLEKDPELAKKFLSALQKSLVWANDNIDEACDLHVAAVPEVALDDCVGSLTAMLAFVFNDSQEEFGLGRFGQDRLDFTYKQVAAAQDLATDFDTSTAIDESYLP